MTVLSGNRVIPRSIINSSGNRTINLDLFVNLNCPISNNGYITINGLVSGSKTLIFYGSGITELTNNNNTYNGNIQIRNGTLKLSGNSKLLTRGTGVSDPGNGALINGILEHSSSEDLIINNQILNSLLIYGISPNLSSKIISNGPGKIHFRTPNAQNLFPGILEINENGYIKVGNNDTIKNNNVGTGTGTIDRVPAINLNGTLEFDRNLSASSTNVNANISGSGTIKVTRGNIIFAGISSHTGPFTIESGNVTMDRQSSHQFINNANLILNMSDPLYWQNTGNWVYSKTVGGTTTLYTLNIDYIIGTAVKGSVNTQIQSAGLGNDISEFAGFVPGRIAVVQRGVQSFQTKVNNAISAGAVGVIIYNDTTGLTTPTVTASIPVILITRTAGEQIVAELSSGVVTASIDTGVPVNATNTPLFNNNVSGTGILTKSGTGTIMIGSNVNHAGSTNVTGGVLRLNQSNSLSGSSSISVSNGTAVETSGNILLNTNISVNGAGISSGGAIRNISGDNTLSGATTLTAASRINSDAGTLTINGNASGAHTLTVGGAGNTTINGVFSVNTLTKDGAGTLELTAVNTYPNGTTISAGTLKLTGGGIAGTSTITNNSSLVIENNEGTTIPNPTAGTGTLVKNLNTRVISNGNLNHTGTTTINAGTLALGSNASVGGSTGNFVVNAGATLEINRSANSTFSRPFSGSGSLLISSNSAAIFTSNLTHTGGTTVNAGTLVIGDGSTSTASISGNIVNNATVQFNRSNFTYGGIISGTGNLIKSNANSLTLTGNNSYSGTTTLSAGTLRIAHANALGSGTSTISIPGGTVLELIGDIVFTRNIVSASAVSTGALRSISGNNTFNGTYTQTGSNTRINCDAGLLVLGNTISGEFGLAIGGAGDTRVDGQITTLTTLTKDGVGTVELTAANTYTSTTSIGAGTLKLTGNGTVGAGGITNNAALIVENNDGTTIARAISGTGTLTKNLNTKVIFTDTLSHTGVTTINAGTLAFGNGGTIGGVSGSTGNYVINSGATLEINRSNASTFSRPISGAGNLVKAGAGTLTLTGNNTYSGTTTINGGTLRAGNATAFGTGTITINAGATLDRAGFTITNTIANNGGTIIN